MERAAKSMHRITERRKRRCHWQGCPTSHASFASLSLHFCMSACNIFGKPLPSMADLAPVANGHAHTSEMPTLANGPTKLSAAEKRRLRKRQSKLTKQAERRVLTLLVHAALYFA